METNQNTTLAKPKTPQASLRSWLLTEAAKADLAAVSTNLISGDRLANVLYQCVTKTPDLMKCTPASLMSACKTLALMGCEPDSVHGYLVPRFTKQGMSCIPIPSARGLLRMARANGIQNLNIGIVHEGEHFTWTTRNGEFSMNHDQDPFDVADTPVRGYYVTWSDPQGHLHGVAMSTKEVEAIRDRSDAWKAYVNKQRTCPWVTDPEQMALKTVIKRAAKQWDLPITIAQAMADADNAEFGEKPAVRNVTRITPAPVLDEQEEPVTQGTLLDVPEQPQETAAYHD